MKVKVLVSFGLIGVLSMMALGVTWARWWRGDGPGQALRTQAEKQHALGNYKDAFNLFRRLALDPKDDPKRVGDDLTHGVECLGQLGRVEEADDFREAVIAVHAANWRLLDAAAGSYLKGPAHEGTLIAGRFHRAVYQGGRHVGSQERDRARALQLLVQGLDRAMADPDRPAAAQYLLTLSRVVMSQRAEGASWRLQELTRLDRLPDYGDNLYGSELGGTDHTGAPVAADGTPVYYLVPESFARAASDGERWRWALAQAARLDPSTLNATRNDLASFLHSQFGTETIAGAGLEGPAVGPPGADGPFALHTLADDETIARLATGIRRFRLPDEFNPIRIYQQVVDDSSTGYGEEALGALASIFENRRQFDRAASYLDKSRFLHGDRDDEKLRHIDQILAPWGQFQTTRPQPAGRGATLDFLFRNGRRVHFDAFELHEDRLLKHVTDFLATHPPQVDDDYLDVDNIGARVVMMSQAEYLGPLVASWDLDLDPPAGHFDRRISVATPFQKPGAYLVTAKMEGGNTSRIVVWLDDTVIVKKNMAGKAYYFVADARTGRPVPGAEVRLFGWRRDPMAGAGPHAETRELSARADDDGQVEIPTEKLTSDKGTFRWLVTASTAEGRLAHMDFSPYWIPGSGEAKYDEVRAYAITDRPVYRPGATVRFKLWVARARYDQPNASEFAGKPFTVEIHDPKGQKPFTGEFRADASGGFDGSFEIPSDATLGVYQVAIPRLGGGHFRVEEYKKPEFEVAVEAPKTPVMLGEKVAATIKASYYFGGPVAKAKVRYKVTRKQADARWYPADRWDWLFGPGYWWFACDSTWYPGWSSWGVEGPTDDWFRGGPSARPEVVAEGEAPIRPDGTFPVEIDTATAKLAHPNDDERYEITAEVTDESRRTIVGTGQVLVARRPFSVYTWVDRGHYRAGDAIEAGLRAMTLDQKPVAGKGTLRLLRIAYDAQGRPAETPVASWDVALDTDGRASRTIPTARPGQYRISARIDDGRDHTVEGGYLLTVTGPGFDGGGFRFGDLEVIPEKKEYRAGETVRVLINTNRADSTVLLFLRPVDRIYQRPRVIRLRGKSEVVEFGVAAADMPNIYVEALTISDGRVHDQARQIVVPPESRIVDVKVEPSQPVFKPGQKARVRVKLTGADGKPFVGSTVLAVYDRAVDYIAGGSNVPDIRAFFWNWRRHHNPQFESSLDRLSSPLIGSDEPAMMALGLFGSVDDKEDEFVRALVTHRSGMPRMPAGIAGMGGGITGRMAVAKSDAAGAATAPAGDEAPALAAPMPPLPPMNFADLKERRQTDGGEPNTAAFTVRTNFADTAFWAPALQTGPDGTAEVEFPLPESLTTWKVKSWAMGPGTRVGQSDVEIVTTKNLLVRIQAPRFFVEKDEVVLSANVHNKLKTRKSVQVALELDGSTLQPMEESARTVDIDAGSERRVDWRVKVMHEGQAIVRMKALTDEESDAAQMTFPAYVHGMLRTEAFAGAVRPEQQSARVVVRVPAERDPAQSRLELRYSPTLAGALVDALPYLADYPYGCTEQTLNRFLPTVIAQRVLINLRVDLKAVKAHHTNLNAQELGDARDRARRWKGHEHNPVFDADEVARMARSGLARLAEMQLADGGWGWFSGQGEQSWAHTTALVVHGLQAARANDLALPKEMLERGVAWLEGDQATQLLRLDNAASKLGNSKESADDLDALVLMVLADAGRRNDRMLAYLDRDRTRLSVYGLALYGLALERLGDRARLATVLQNLRQYVVRDDENGTAYLKLPNRGFWWHWYGSDTETHAFYLKLLARTEPKGELAPRLVRYILNSRRHGTYWDSTRDTAFCVEAMAEYLSASGEDRPDMTVAIAVDGRERKRVKIAPADLFQFDNGFSLDGNDLTTGEHAITITREGTGSVYFNAYLTYFSREDPIPRAGVELTVDRKVYRLVREDQNASVAGGRGQVVNQRVEHYRREPLADGATVRSGELVEVELKIDSKNDYEYLLFEDCKPAGFEPVEVRSGYNGNELGAYVEFRDERVAFFVARMNRGGHSVSYRLRAEIPGRFHALPARAQAMYAPELRGNSDEIRLGVQD